MIKYRIYIKSNKHPRTINTPMMGRTYYDVFEVLGREAMEAKVSELLKMGEIINEIRTLNNRYFVYNGKII